MALIMSGGENKQYRHLAENKYVKASANENGNKWLAMARRMSAKWRLSYEILQSIIGIAIPALLRRQYQHQ
jgi:hypothetical protein